MRRLHSKKRQAGAAIVEYVVGSIFVLSAILFVPVPRALNGDGQSSAGEMLIDAFVENYGAYVWAMSIPI